MSIAGSLDYDGASVAPSSTSTSHQASGLGPFTGKKRKGGPMVECPLVKRIPAIQRSGNEIDDLRRQNMKEDFAELLNLLWNCPDRINESLAFAKKLGKKVSEDAWQPITPNFFCQIPKPDLFKFFAERGFTPTYLDEANVRDDGLLIQLFSMVLHVPQTMGLPNAAKQSPATFWRWAHSRAAEVDRVDMVKKALKVDSYDKASGGAYDIKWKNGVAAEVMHTSTGDIQAMNPAWKVTKEWQLQQWHSDMAATISHGKALKLQLSDCFKPSSGPFKRNLTKAQLEKAMDNYSSSDCKTDAPEVVIEGSGEELMVKSKISHQATQAARAKANLQKHRQAKAVRNTINF